MSVKIRLNRMGKLRAPHYRVVVIDERKARNGRAIEEIGRYVPTADPSIIEIDSERAQYWLSVGAQPSAQVHKLLELTGDWGMFKGEKNAKSTVAVAAEPEAFKADESKPSVVRETAKPAQEAKAEAPAEEAKAEAPAEPAAEETPAEA